MVCQVVSAPQIGLLQLTYKAGKVLAHGHCRLQTTCDTNTTIYLLPFSLRCRAVGSVVALLLLCPGDASDSLKCDLIYIHG
jgi:hypothetical protein